MLYHLASTVTKALNITTQSVPDWIININNNYYDFTDQQMELETLLTMPMTKMRQAFYLYVSYF